MCKILYLTIPFFAGYAHLEYGKAATQLALASIKGDKTGVIHVTDAQILKAAVREGSIGSFTTNVNIEVASTAILHVPHTLIIAATYINLEGTASFKNLIIEKDGILTMHATSYTSNYVDGLYESTSDKGSFFLSSMKLKHGSNFQPPESLILRIGTFEMKRYIVLEVNFVDIIAETLILEREARLNVLGRASPNDPIVPENSHGTGKNGGAHAAQGGVGSGSSIDNAAQPYGTLYRKEDMKQTPMRPGSSGGGGGMGGGYIKITADDFILDGILQASGADSTAGGGGSGGSIYVQVKQLKGLGSMVSDGGSVTCHACGAGSGGYIGVNMVIDSFEGKYSAAGGTSPAPNGDGGPGSIYTVSGTNGEKLTVDNENGQKNYYMTLKEIVIDVVFDVVDLYNYAMLQLVKDGIERTLNIKKINGDGTGLVRIQQSQIGILERLAPSSTTGTKMNSKLNINIELHKGGTFFFSETTLILGLADTALDLDGTLKGATNLYLGTGRHMRIGGNALIQSDVNAVADDTAPKVSFGIFQLEPGSICEFDPNIGAEISTGSLNLKFAATIKADYFEVNSSIIHIELESDLSCSGVNRPDSDTMDVTDGSGKFGGKEIGGAGHGGVGGGSKDLSGSPYNSLYFPEKSGSRGTVKDGTKLGGKGGGRIHLRVGSQLINDGKLSADGEPANSEGGGGSGGSILVETYDIEGYGEISSKGGYGSGNHGGGSGGLIAILSTSKIFFRGDYLVYGGRGASDKYSAGSGIVYLKDNRLGKIYKRLLLNNNGLPHDKMTTIDEKPMTYHYFDEVHLDGNAALHMIDDNIPVLLEIDQLFGDGTGLLHIHMTQQLKAEYKTTIRHAITAGVNFIIDQGAEILFPSIVYIYGDGIYLTGLTKSPSLAVFGTLTGISDLILSFEKFIYFGPESNTAFKSNNGEYLYKTDPRTIKFGTIDCKSLSELRSAPDINIEIESAKIDMRYQSKISSETIYVIAGIFRIEAGAILSSSAIERPEDVLDEEMGVGLDAVNPVTIGTGAGYASTGGGKNIRIYHECEGRIEKSVPRIAVWHHKACRVMTNSDPEGWIFLSYPHTNNGLFFLLITVFIYLFIYLF